MERSQSSAGGGTCCIGGGGGVIGTPGLRMFFETSQSGGCAEHGIDITMGNGTYLFGAGTKNERENNSVRVVV